MTVNPATTMNGRGMTPARGAVRRDRPADHDGAYAFLLLLPFAWAALFIFTRQLGAPALAVALAPMLVIGLGPGRRYLTRSLILFAIVTAVYAMLSYAGLLDRHLTLLFDRRAIFQQCAYGLFLPFAVASFAFYHQKVVEGRPWFLRLEETVFILALLYRLFALVTIRSTVDIDADSLESTVGLSQFVNGETFIAFIFVRRLLQSPRASKPIGILIAACLILTAGSAQSRLSLLPLLAILVLPSLRRQVAVGFIVALLLTITVAWQFADQIWNIDPNTGIRLFFWQDSIRRFFESYGVGVGFGTETIRPIYNLSQQDVVLKTMDDPSFIFVGSHNALIDALYRMGVVGFSCFLYYLILTIRSVLRRTDTTLLDSWVVCLSATVLLVNVGLVSFNFFFGSCLLLGWLTYRASHRPEMNLIAQQA